MRRDALWQKQPPGQSLSDERPARRSGFRGISPRAGSDCTSSRADPVSGREAPGMGRDAPPPPARRNWREPSGPHWPRENQAGAAGAAAIAVLGASGTVLRAAHVLSVPNVLSHPRSRRRSPSWKGLGRRPRPHSQQAVGPGLMPASCARSARSPFRRRTCRRS